MRHLPIAIMTSLALVLAACGDDSSPEGIGPAGDAGTDTRRDGSVGSSQIEFTDLPGKIRFINFVSDGTRGVNVDLYWGISLARSERVGTVEYGEVTEYITPRHSDELVLKADEARYFLVTEGDVSGTAASFLYQDDQTFITDTVLTVALSAAKNASGNTVNVSAQTFYEAELSIPPAGMAHVFGWSLAFGRIDKGNFVFVGAAGLCSPDRGQAGGANLGAPALIPDGTTGLSLFDANTVPPCKTSAAPVTQSVEAGRSYVLLGEAETYELDARRTVLLEVGTAN